MNCPCCGKEMTPGWVQSTGQIYFTIKTHEFIRSAKERHGDTILTDWEELSCTAYHCRACQKVVIDYAANSK